MANHYPKPFTVGIRFLNADGDPDYLNLNMKVNDPDNIKACLLQGIDEFTEYYSEYTIQSVSPI